MRAVISPSQSVDNPKFVGTSPEARRINRTLNKFSRVDDCVLIAGDLGTGKRFCARSIHLRSRRRKNAFVVLNCAALGGTTDKKDLYGSEEITGTREITPGLLETANNGTLYLDNLPDLSPQYQSELLQIVSDRNFTRVGGSETITLNVRIISSSAVEMEEEVHNGRFKKELFHRLSELQIWLPKLHERKQDIPELMLYFLRDYCEEHELEIPAIPAEIFEAMLEYDWKGNIRELQDCVHNLVVMSAPGELSVDYLPFENGRHPLDFLEAKNLNRVISDVETHLIKKALGKYGGNQVKAARLLGIPEATLRFKIKKYAIQKEEP